MVEIPAALEQLAAERGLGPCDHRFRRRVTIFSVLGVFAAAGVVLLLLMLSAAPVVVLALPIWIAWLLVQRRRGGGLYLFTGGFVVVRGWTVPQVVTWDEVEEIRREGMVVTAFQVPVTESNDYHVELKNRVLSVTLDSTYEDFQKAATIMRSRVRRTGAR
ncbi:hypothetical protein [Lentzea sp. HUAS12]|uniref:hypothetical protein n=1 Tax=Lentzea sp. HUAS12 TaxID=2951806 RepID=UPI0020A04A39|nr:hypothetical protein [Lentzea sp. HUAS12]USX55192.1 hypothetical protein ND450_14150 [Lentzea sp. HUAS12]